MERFRQTKLIGALAAALLCSAAPLRAAEENATELAKKTQNPVADLISVPFQNNFNFGAGANRRWSGS